MIVSYITDDNVLVSVCHIATMPDGVAKWQAAVEGMGGMARWGVPDLPANPRWSAERVARLALEWAQSLPDSDPCKCGSPDCPVSDPQSATTVFGPTNASSVGMTGPYLDRKSAIAELQVRCGDDPSYDEPSVDELVDKIDQSNKPTPKRQPPPDPHDGSTWRLG